MLADEALFRFAQQYEASALASRYEAQGLRLVFYLYFLNIKPERALLHILKSKMLHTPFRRASYIFAPQKYASFYLYTRRGLLFRPGAAQSAKNTKNTKNTGYLWGRRCNFALVTAMACVQYTRFGVNFCVQYTKKSVDVSKSQ